MPKPRFSVSFLIGLLVDVLDSQSIGSLGNYLNIFSIICYFSQLLGYISRFGFDYFDKKLDFFFHLLYYTNFANFLYVFQSRSVIVIAYVGVIFVILSFYFYIGLISVIQLYFKLKWKTLLFFRICNMMMAVFFKYFIWLLQLPFLEILINPLYCGFAGSFFVSCDEIFSVYCFVPSILVSVLTVFLGLVYMIVNCNYKFLDFYELSVKLNFGSLLAYIIRCSLPLFFPLLEKQIYISVILMHCFSILTLINYMQFFPIRSPTLNPLFSAMNICFEMVMIVLTFWQYFGVLIEESVFYSFMIVLVLGLKLGYSYFFSKKMDIFLSNFSNKDYVDYALEEVLYLFNNHQGSTTNYFLMNGMLMFHAKNCSNNICKLKSKTMRKFEELSLLRKHNIINAFITQRFGWEIDKECKLKGTKQEQLILKYISYLINSNCNTSKAFYETQKIKLLYNKRSFLGEILVSTLLRKVEHKIQDIEREKTIAEGKNIESNLEVSAFFRIFREKHVLEDKLKKLVEAKIKFWDVYKEGFESYDDLLKHFQTLSLKIQSFSAKMQEYSDITISNHQKIVLYRFFSIFNSIILNHLPDALDFEEKIDNIRKRFLHVNKEQMSPLMFLKENLVICEASFLNNGGKIIEKSKNEKFAKFFGYSVEDLKALNTIDHLMPEFIGEFHTKLIFWSFVRTRKEQIAYDSEIYTHAQDKQGFLFPIKIFVGFNFHYLDDYVANAGILKLQESGYEELFFGADGAVLGFNREFFAFLKGKFENISIKQANTLSLFSLAPRIKEIVEAEQIFTNKKANAIRNQSCVLSLPHNLIEIIELLLYYQMEVEALENTSNKNSRSGYFSSNNTFRTNRSTTSINHKTGVNRSLKQNKDLIIRLNNFLLKTETLQGKKDVIINFFQDHSLTPEALMNKLIDPHKTIKCKTSIDLIFKFHRYGKTPSQVISIGQIIFTKINILETKSEARPLLEKKVEESMISDNLGNPIILPPQNRPEFGIDFERLSLPSGRSQKENKANVLIESSFIYNETFENDEMENSNKPEVNQQRSPNKEKKKDDVFILVRSQEINKNPESFAVENQENEKSGVNSSVKSSEFNRQEKNEIGKMAATDMFAMKEMELQGSQRSSSSTSKKTAFSILGILEMLHKRLPKSIFRLNYLLLFQTMLILIFCVIYYNLAGQYIDSYYVPLKTALTNQLRINSAITISTIIFVNLENHQLGFKNLSSFEFEEMFIRLEENYQIATELFYKDRNTAENFNFSGYLQNWMLPYVDDTDFKAQNILLVDLTDNFINVINNIRKNTDLTTATNSLKVLPRNYIDYLLSTFELRNIILNEFINSNGIVTQKLLIVLIISIVLVVFAKFIEFYLLLGFYARITRLFNIFLRVSAKESINETLFLKEMLESIKDKSRNFININFTDLLLTKRNYSIQMEDENILQSQKMARKKELKKSKKKTMSLTVKSRAFLSLHPFSKTRVFLFLLITGGSTILYFSFNYYFWMSCNSNINSLLSKTENINNLFIYSSTVPCFNNLLLRELIKRDPEYEASNAEYQNHANRLTELTYLFNSRLAFLDSYLQSLPNYIMSAEQDLNNPIFSELVKNDLCAVLQINHDLTDQEKNYCESMFNSAMDEGIFSAMNEYLNELKANTIYSDINSNLSDALKTQKALEFVTSSSYSEITIGSMLLSDALSVLYGYFAQFYLGSLEKSIAQLTIFVWIMSTVCILLMLIFLFALWKASKRMYGVASGSLDMIPLEKLSFDEQTIFLIKSFYKEYL